MSIIRKNIFTAFNALNLALALAIIIFGDAKNALFMGVVLCNIVIGIVQEMRAKKLLDKLRLITAPKALLVRFSANELAASCDPRTCKDSSTGGDSRTCEDTSTVDDPRTYENAHITEVSPATLEEGDIIKLTAGMQVCADAEIIEGSPELDESMLTGEADPVSKHKVEKILAGSTVVVGTCYARVLSKPSESYAEKLTKQAKKMKAAKSEILTAVNKIIKILAIAIIPIGTLLFLKQLHSAPITDANISRSVTSTVAALVGMIPEGLVLLTSLVLAVGIVRLSKKNALVQELYSIEMLARVDVLCLDKTGTITEGKLKVENLIAVKSIDGTGNLNNAREDLIKAARVIFAATKDENPTAKAIKDEILKMSGEKCAYDDTENAQAGSADGNITNIIFAKEATDVLAFSSTRKYSGATIDGITYICGAPEIILGSDKDPLIKKEEEKGNRVVAFAVSDKNISQVKLPQDVRLLGFIILSDVIRDGAAETIEYFKKQGVKIKVISGDSALTVSKIASKVGIDDSESYIDMSAFADIDETKSEEELAKFYKKIANLYTIFGRVTPEQKQLLIRAMKRVGHTVAMSGDGVNDLMALKESDCSIAPATACDAARRTAQIVLMDSNFASLPSVVAEGRRSINNLQRSATLFLTKTIFASVVAVVFIFLKANYPLAPIQMTLINALTIGAPSFVLGLEPNKERVKGHFLRNVFTRAIPGAVTSIISVILATVLLGARNFTYEEISTVSAMLLAFGGFLVLARISMPYNKIRISLIIAMMIAYAAAIMIMPSLFSMQLLNKEMLLAFASIAMISTAVFVILNIAVSKIRQD